MALSAEPYDIKFVSSNMTFLFVVNLNFNFPQVVRQRTLGVVGYYYTSFYLQFTALSNSQRILKID